MSDGNQPSHRWVNHLWYFMLLPMAASAWARDLWAPDEPRYAQVAREVYERGDFLVMHLCGQLYPDKPPLLFWASGVFGWLSGWSEFWMRMPSLLATAATAWLVSLLARRWWGEVAGLLAPGLYLGTAMVTEIGGRLQIDPLLTLLCTLALYLLACDDVAPLTSNRRVLLAGLCVGIGGLAKGPMSLVNVGLVVGAWAWLSPRTVLPRVRWTVWLCALILSIAPALLWAVLASLAEPTLVGELFFGQHAARVTRADRHPGPIWKHLVRVPLLLLPWTMAVAAGLASACRGLRRTGAGQGSHTGFVLAAGWLLTQLVFYSVIPPKRDLYLLPAYPAAALLAAGALAEYWRNRRLPSWIGIGSPLVLLVVGSALSLVWLATDQVSGLWWRGPLIGLPLMAGAISAVAWLKRDRFERWAVAILASWCVFGVLLAVAGMRPINPLKSARQLAVELVARPERPTEIPCWGVQPEGYRFYSDGHLPVISSSDLDGALNREGPDFLALVRRPEWQSVDPYLKARLRVLMERQVGGKDIVVLGAAVP